MATELKNQETVKIDGYEYRVVDGEVAFNRYPLEECPRCGSSLALLHDKKTRGCDHHRILQCPRCGLKVVQCLSTTTVLLHHYKKQGYAVDTYYERRDTLKTGDACPNCGAPVKFIHAFSIDAEVTYYHVCDKCKTIWKWNTRDAWAYKGARAL